MPIIHIQILFVLKSLLLNFWFLQNLYSTTIYIDFCRKIFTLTYLMHFKFQSSKIIYMYFRFKYAKLNLFILLRIIFRKYRLFKIHLRPRWNLHSIEFNWILYRYSICTENSKIFFHIQLFFFFFFP